MLNLEKELKALGMSKAQFASELGMSLRILNKKLKNEIPFSPKEAGLIVSYVNDNFEYRTEWLLGETKDNTPKYCYRGTKENVDFTDTDIFMPAC